MANSWWCSYNELLVWYVRRRGRVGGRKLLVDFDVVGGWYDGELGKMN
ncbi:MAG TPA: hypothetical protein VNI77_04655 [Nitrososphaera sp.]|nr:hypothetical protein [Nitrososphaera sp.]